jgi:hypothetical protein
MSGLGHEFIQIENLPMLKFKESVANLLTHASYATQQKLMVHSSFAPNPYPRSTLIFDIKQDQHSLPTDPNPRIHPLSIALSTSGADRIFSADNSITSLTESTTIQQHGHANLKLLQP